YYSVDENNNYIPSIMLQITDDKSISAVHGNDNGDIADNSLIDVLKAKIAEIMSLDSEMSVSDDIIPRIDASKLLNTIENKVAKGKELTKEELIFIYGLERNVESIGYPRERDFRVNSLIAKRNVKKDMATIFECEEALVGDKPSDLQNTLMVYYGDLDIGSAYSYKSLINYTFPRIVIGTIDASYVETASNVNFPDTIMGGFLHLSSLKTMENVTLPSKCNYMDLSSLVEIKTPTFVPIDKMRVELPQIFPLIS
ncbi:MAG: hypothetical protein K2J20_02195, partial [Bacilli bacterium]|nr:hypothetical protein [Bacilli bacterium]